MDIVEAIQQRYSVRAFKPDPVPQRILKEIMEVARRAPSWANTQPWKFIIASGKALEEIKQGCVQKAEEPAKMEIDLPPDFPEPYGSRRRLLGGRMLEINKVTREDRERRKWWREQGLELFGAPCAIYICIDRALYSQGEKTNVWPLFDCGIIAQTIMLLAPKYGLGTIAEAAAAHYPQVLRTVLGIPDSELIVVGIPIGYPNPDAPINQFRAERESVDKIVRWYGFKS